MKKIVLDTNAYRGLMDEDEKMVKVVESAKEVILPIVVVGELFEAFKLGTREKFNLEKIEMFLDRANVTLGLVSVETAHVYADIRVKLHRKGKPIPVNDVWIAALTMESGAVLVTNDGHFKEIAGLRVWGS